MMPRLLCVFAHPDDEVFCAGGTIARYAAEGYEVMVVSATRGDAGQIRDAAIATRRTLGKVRESELMESCRRLGAQHAVCLDYGDGTLKSIDMHVLVEHVARIIREFRPDVVITFGPDGAYGHPDHIAIGEATTLACVLAPDPREFPHQISYGLQPHAPLRLYHSYFPRNHMLMLEKLSKWLADDRSIGEHRFEPTEFVRALLAFAEESTLLHYASDRMDVNWYPAGFYIIEQGEVAKDLYLILSGHAEAVREHEDGSLEPLGQMGPGSFFGEKGVATRGRRSAHVIARDNVTCLVLSMDEAVAFAGRGSGAAITGGADLNQTAQSLVEYGNATSCINVADYVGQKIAAMAAHRSQYPITPDIFPLDLLQDLMGNEYFVRVLPRPVLETSLFPEMAHA
jgi:LmbE family N-acetylglucosaminyl deacetylase